MYGKDQAPELVALADQLSKEQTGISRSEAWEKGICIECKELALPKCYSPAGKREYGISGMCEKCFDALFAEEA